VIGLPTSLGINLVILLVSLVKRRTRVLLSKNKVAMSVLSNAAGVSTSGTSRASTPATLRRNHRPPDP